MKFIYVIAMLASFTIAGCTMDDNALTRSLPYSDEGEFPSSMPLEGEPDTGEIESPGDEQDGGLSFVIKPGGDLAFTGNAEIGIGSLPETDPGFGTIIAGGITFDGIEPSPDPSTTFQPIQLADECKKAEYTVKVDGEDARTNPQVYFPYSDFWHRFDIISTPAAAKICPSCQKMNPDIRDRDLNQDEEELLGEECITALDCTVTDGPVLCINSRCVRKPGFPYSKANGPFILECNESTSTKSSWFLHVNFARIGPKGTSMKLDLAPHLDGCEPKANEWTVNFQVY